MLTEVIDRLGELDPNDPTDRQLILQEFLLVRNTGKQQKLRYATCKTLGEAEQAQQALGIVERSMTRLNELAEEFPWIEAELRARESSRNGSTPALP